MKIVKGDLIEMAKARQFDVIAHGCNCFNTMGGGIARVIAETWPEVAQADDMTTPGDAAKLGTILRVPIASTRAPLGLIVVNCYTQFDYWGVGIRLDYEALRRCLEWLARFYPDRRIGLPKIGTGLARGDWSRIEVIMDETLADRDAMVVALE